MEIGYPRFGKIVVGSETFDHDVIIEGDEVRARDKGPSREFKADHGHTPLSVNEDIPWSKPRLVIGSGYSGRLPVMPEVTREAEKRGVDLVVVPTAKACDLLAAVDRSEVGAVLHVTC
jgi:hypothetical protein